MEQKSNVDTRDNAVTEVDKPILASLQLSACSTVDNSIHVVKAKTEFTYDPEITLPMKHDRYNSFNIVVSLTSVAFESSQTSCLTMCSS